MFVLSVVGLCGSVACLGAGVSMLRHRSGNSVSITSSKPASVKVANGKHDVLGMCREIDAKLSSDEHTELMVVPPQAEGEQV
jgi:hypothetical protein